MKAAVRDSVDAGVYSDFDGVGHYLAWFQQRHLRTCWDAHNHLWKRSTDYSAVFPYDPQAVSCKVDDDTYLIRFPSCMGDPDDRWIKQSVKDYKASGCKFLILDIRGNGGGADHYYEPYLELLKANPKASIYFCDAKGFKGMMFRGTMEVLTDAKSKEMIWRKGDTQYYPGGVTDPNYCVLKFTATDGRFYRDFYPRSFVL